MTIGEKMHPLGVALLSLVITPGICAPGDPEWTEQEKECARSIGIELGKRVSHAEELQFRKLAWYADAIVVGVVRKEWHELEGYYHTMVEVRIEEVLKGTEDRRAVVVALRTGPFYNKRIREIMTVRVSSDVELDRDEHVLLFLTRDPPSPEFPPPPHGSYRILRGSKYEVNGDEVVWEGVERYPLDRVRQEITLAVVKQASGCRSKDLSEADKAGIQQIYPLPSGPENCEPGGGGGRPGGGSCLVNNAELSLEIGAGGEYEDPENGVYGPHSPWDGPPCYANCRSTGLATALAHYFRDFVLLKTAAGREFVARFERNNDEVVAIFRKDPDLAREVGSLINDFMPGLLYFLFADPAGEDLVFDEAKMASVRRVADRVAASGSPELKADLEWFMVRLARERGKRISGVIVSMLGDSAASGESAPASGVP